ncbi:MAG: hypothetical protein WAN35_11400 [Terracidiphilus sp.]
MDGFDLVEARKVFCIEGQDALYVMDVHGGNESHIMHLNAADAIIHQQAASYVMNRLTIRKKPKRGFNVSGSNLGDRRSVPVSVSVCWTGHYIPEFTKIL